MMHDDTRRVLELLAQGKVTIDQAEQLLRALAEQPATAPAREIGERAERAKPRYVRITVHKTAAEGGKDKDVNIRVPIAIVKSGMRLGAMIPDVANDHVTAKLRERGLDVDFSKLDPAAIDQILQDLGDRHIDIDAGKAQVRITAE
jgi:hypothetical protein